MTPRTDFCEPCASTQALELDERDRNRLLVLLTDPPPHFQELQRVLSGGSPLRWGQLETT